MYDFFPQRRNHIAQYLVLTFFAVAAACFVASGLLPAARIPLQAIGLVCIFPLLQIAARFLFTRYLYRLCPYEDGNTDIEVYAYRGGARMQLVCRVGLEEITATAPLTEANRKPQKGMHRYNYSPDIRPPEALVLSITNEDGDCEVLLCPDEHLTRVLTTPHVPPVLPTEAQEPAGSEDSTEA